MERVNPFAFGRNVSCTSNMLRERRGNSIRTRIELKRMDGTVAGTISYTTTQRAAKKKYKKLQYNFKEISSQLFKTKKAGNARQVWTSAKQKVAFLKKKQRTDEYDDEELESAILHAEAVARAARKKMKHLEEEEAVRKKDGADGGEYEEKLSEESEEYLREEEVNEEAAQLSGEQVEKLMENMAQMELEMQKLSEDLSEMDDFLKELTGAFAREMEPQDLEQLKKKHRSDEQRDVMEADMKYLKAMFHKLAKEKASAGAGGNGAGTSSGGGFSGSDSVTIGGIETFCTSPPEPVMTEGANVDVEV